MSSNVIAKVEKVIVQVPYSEKRIEASFVGDLLYVITVPNEHRVSEDGQAKVFTIEGIRHIIRNLQVVLYIETDEDDF